VTFLISFLIVELFSQQMKEQTSKTDSSRFHESEILAAIRGIRFGIVEIVVHDSRVMEIRQTKRVRFEANTPGASTTNLKTGG
jgi:hypothetical protein